MVLIIFVIQILLLTTVSSVSDYKVSPSQTDDLIYVGTAISPFFDGGASSSFLSDTVPSMLSNKLEEKNSVASITDERKRKPPIAKKLFSIRRKKQGLSSEHIEKICSAWTPEKRRKQAAIILSTSSKRNPESDVTNKAWWTEERRKIQAEKHAKQRLALFIHTNQK